MSAARLAAAAVVLAHAIAAAAAQDKPAAAVSAWVREPAAGQTSTDAFVAIDNPTMYEVWIVSAAADAAASVELREARKDDPSQSMAVKELGVPAYGKLEMAGNGAMLRLIGLTKPLKAGDHVALTLKTDSGGVVRADAVVRR